MMTPPTKFPHILEDKDKNDDNKNQRNAATNIHMVSP